MTTMAINRPTRSLRSDKGAEVQTNLTDDEAIRLVRLIACGTRYASRRDQEFAQSLENQWKARGLSSNQWVYVHKLAMAPPTPPKREAALQVDFDRVSAMFARAAKRIKYPSITLRTADGLEVCIRLAGDKSSEPGSIAICGEYDPTSSRRFWFGRISTDGSFHSLPKCPPSVVDLIRRLNELPEEVATEYGRLTGHCCFCNLKLTDGRSVAVGYGPICADHYGLPWG